jgi:hypothetical protein
LTLNNDQIVKLIEGYEKESRAFKDEALRMSWFMRGGISYDDAMMLSSMERELINTIIKDNMEVTKKSGLAFF